MTDQQTNDETTDDLMWDPGMRDRREAYHHIQRAKEQLNRAAQCLGFDNCNDLGTAAMNIDLDHDDDEAVKGLTNAYSYLDNGQVEMMLIDE